MNEKLVFSTIIYPTEAAEANTILLAASIRARAGALSQARIWCYSPQYGKEISPATRDRLHQLNVELRPFEIERDVLRFFFTAGVTAASLAESAARGQTEFLAWVDSNTIVLQEPGDFLLQDDKSLGFRPVHHTLVGSRYDGPLDPFWRLVYGCCGVPEDHVFPMTAHVDGVRIRPYFNAGLLIVRPEKGLLQAWYDRFFQVYQSPEFREFYERDGRYPIFAHQAILTGVLLSALAPDEMQELPPTYNYPLHLYEEDVTDRRPARLEELETCRHEGLASALEVIDSIPAEASLKQWLTGLIMPSPHE
jgi:hypothetical protein